MGSRVGFWAVGFLQAYIRSIEKRHRLACHTPLVMLMVVNGVLSATSVLPIMICPILLT
jgi:ABC-type phosphate transport system permease subunit